MFHRGTDTIEPGALIGAARRGEGRARDLLGIEPVGTALRRVAPHRQRARQPLGLKAVAEAGHVTRRDLRRAPDDLIGRDVDVHRSLLKGAWLLASAARWLMRSRCRLLGNLLRILVLLRPRLSEENSRPLVSGAR